MQVGGQRDRGQHTDEQTAWPHTAATQCAHQVPDLHAQPPHLQHQCEAELAYPKLVGQHPHAGGPLWHNIAEVSRSCAPCHRGWCAQSPHDADSRAGALVPPKAPKLVKILFGAYRRQILALLLLRPDESFYVREIGRLSGVPAGALHRELKLLSDAGLLQRSVAGNQMRYQES